MNVKELKESLKDLPDDMEVIMQNDSEANGFSPLASADPECVYVPESTWDGYVYSANWSSYDAGMEEEEWQDLLSQPRVLCLAPVN